MKGRDLQPYVEACTAGLAKVKPYAGTAIGCDRTVHASIVEQLLAGGRRVEHGFMSAGLERVPGFGDIVTEIVDLEAGAEVTMFSLHGTEGEVPFPPGSSFELVSFRPTDTAAPITDWRRLAGVLDDGLTQGVSVHRQLP